MLLFLLLCAVILQMKLLLEVVNPLDPKGLVGLVYANIQNPHFAALVLTYH